MRTRLSSFEKALVTQAYIRRARRTVSMAGVQFSPIQVNELWKWFSNYHVMVEKHIKYHVKGCKFLPRTLKSENISELFVCVAVLSAQSRGVNLCRTEDILGHRKDSGKCWRLSLWKPITKLKGLTMALLQKLFLSFHVYLYGKFISQKIINMKKNKLHFSVFFSSESTSWYSAVVIAR